MVELERKHIPAMGLQGRSQATCEFLRRSDPRIVSVDNAYNGGLRQAGDKDEGLDFHYLGPQLSTQCKRAFLAGEVSEGIRPAWNLFTPCALARSLLEAVAEAAKNTTSGDVVLLALAGSSWGQLQNHQNRGEVFCRAVKSIGRGVRSGNPNINGKTVRTLK
jgi:hypothetical protein